MFSVLNVVEAWNEISWGDAIPFILVLTGLYWVKVKIDTSAGLGRKKSRQLKIHISKPCGFIWIFMTIHKNDIRKFTARKNT